MAHDSNPPPTAHATTRRSFMSWALVGLSALFSAILGVPVAGFILDPLNRRGKVSHFKPVEGIQLDEMTRASPKQGVIRDTRQDGWILYPNDVVGRVWVVMMGPPPADLATMTPADLTRFNEDEHEKAKYLLVFTTICPHLGCSVNLNAADNEFLCPCHSAAFTMDGALMNRPGRTNPAARPMDTLVWQIDPTERNRILVQYQNFVSSKPTKERA